MSHTAKITAIKITDIVALRSAVEDMNKMGIRCQLVENQAPRAFYQQQEGLGVAPFVLKLDGAKYDVGFYPETQNGVMAYEARTDFYQGSVEKVLGVSDGTDQGKLGKLFNLYSANAVINTAIRKGYRYMRSVNKDTGLTDSVVLTA